MRTIVVDDEPWMLKRFAIECEGLPDVQLLGSFKSSLKALEFAEDNLVELAFLDIEMPALNGLELASKLKEINPDTIIFFISAYDKYMTEAFRSKTADYYIMKPYNSEDIAAAVDRARLLSGRLKKAIFVRTFGAFELFADNKPVIFQNDKAKELLALLIDRRGGIVTANEASGLLWAALPPDEGKINLNRTFKNLIESLSALHLEGIVEKTDSGVFINTNVIDCDLFQFLDGDPKSTRQFSGEYMVSYAWAEKNRTKYAQQSKQLNVYNDAQTRNCLCANIRTSDNSQLSIIYYNDSFLELVGYNGDEIKIRFKNSFRAMILREDFDLAIKKMRQNFEAGESSEVQFRIKRKSGEDVWVICKSEQPKTVSEGIREISSVLFDISDTKTQQKALEHAAHCDSLTGLYNRSYAQESIKYYLEAMEYLPSGALIIIDIDNFKATNDTYGHPFADTVLTDIAAILTRSFRSNDIVCRLGGDEMMIFLKGIDNEPAARVKMNSTAKAIRRRLSIKTQLGELSCSMGGAMCPQNGCDFETLYKNADLALYKAKAKKNCIVWFSEINGKGDEK